ncbi:hypothetical protein ACLMJK_003783 [Lecanora helva]
MESPTSEDYIPTIYIGQHDSERTRVTPDLLQYAQSINYDMLTTPMTTPHFHARVLTLLSNHFNQLYAASEENSPVPTISSLSPVDTPLAPDEIVSQLLAVASPWIDLSSPDPVIYDISRQVLELEIAYAAFCGIGNVILPGPKLHHGKLHGEGIMKYAYAIQEALSIGPYVQLSISLPMMDYPAEEDEAEDYKSLSAHARGKYLGLLPDEYEEFPTEELEENAEGIPQSGAPGKSAIFDFFGTWDAWNIVRTVCKYNSRLFVALAIPSQLPPPSVQSRWQSEPLRILNFRKKTFGENKSGYPALSPYHQSLLTRYLKIRQAPWLLLSDVDRISVVENHEVSLSSIDDSITTDAAPEPLSPTPADSTNLRRKKSQKSRDPTPHLTYLRYLQRHQPPRDTIERFGAGYQDYLQAPLQPLTDNLESVTYEVFEKDPVKYDKYLLAIQQALCDWRDKNKPASGPNGAIVVAVVGAGRGPLVTRALQASDSTGIPIELWAVEKNPNAYVLLQRHNEETWSHRVNLVQSDMRSWKGPVREKPTPFSPTTRSTTTPGYTGQWPPPRSSASDTSCGTIEHHPIPASSSASTPYPTPHQPPQQPPQQQETYPIDIFISELLGSLGDNELSPECLDGILPLLNPSHGISIPHSYTAYLTPIAAPKLHADVSARTATDSSAPNTPYVVLLHAIDYLSTTSRSFLPPPPPTSSPSKENEKSKTKETPKTSPQIPRTVPNIQPAWSFTHTPTPLNPTPPNNNTHNTRSTRLHYNLRDRSVCHGLAGYFEAVLYPAVTLGGEAAAHMPSLPGNEGVEGTYSAVELSTNPVTMAEKSAGMMSWFPMFFPLKTPLHTPDFSTLTVTMFRKTDGRKVWYEWCVEAWSQPGGGGGGRGGWGGGGGKGGRGRGRGRCRLGVSEVGSSKAGGCLM